MKDRKKFGSMHIDNEFKAIHTEEEESEKQEAKENPLQGLFAGGLRSKFLLFLQFLLIFQEGICV